MFLLELCLCQLMQQHYDNIVAEYAILVILANRFEMEGDKTRVLEAGEG